MQTSNAIKRLGKLGTVQTARNHYSVKVGRYVISFFDQDGEAICIATRPETDHSDPQSDYDAHSYWPNLSRAIHYVTVHVAREERDAIPFTEEPLPTSLSGLDQHDWAIVSNTWSRGIDHVVCKLGRKWEVMGLLGKGFPNFTTKSAAHEAATKLVLMESRRRAWFREHPDMPMATASVPQTQRLTPVIFPRRVAHV